MLENIPTPTKEDAGQALERARYKAAINIEILLEALTLRGIDPTASAKAVLEAFEANYKVSGMAARNAAAEAALLNRPSIVFVVPEGTKVAGLTVEGTAQRLDAPDEVPACLTLIPMTNDLSMDLHDE